MSTSVLPPKSKFLSVLLSMVMLSLYSCKKEQKHLEPNIKHHALSISEAKSWIHSYDPKLNLDSNWGRAKAYNLGKQDVVIRVPYREKLLINGKWLLSDVIFRKDSVDQILSFIYTIVVDTSYFSNKPLSKTRGSDKRKYINEADFTGKIILSTLNNVNIKGLKYKNGRLEYQLVKNTSPNKNSVMIKPEQDQDCPEGEATCGGSSSDGKDLNEVVITAPTPPPGWLPGGDHSDSDHSGGIFPIGTGGNSTGENGSGSIKLPNLDASALEAYPKLKAIVEDLPNFLKKYPNVLKALAYYTGFSEKTIMDLMQPGKGPKVIAAENLNSSDGRILYGMYNRDTDVLSINANFARGIEIAQSENTIQATGLLLAITTLHEFVHFGRDVNKLSVLINDFEAGWTFERNIDPNHEGIDKYNAEGWIKYYPYNFQ
jgi:hypothetical protein